MKKFLVFLLLVATSLACSQSGDSTVVDTGSSDNSTGSSQQAPSGAVVVDILYAPESELYLVDAIEQFNQAYIDGNNPLTGEALADGEPVIFVQGGPASSGVVAQGIINAIIAPNNTNVAQPTLFSPSVSHWLALVNYQSGRQIFDLRDSPATALAPVVIAIWESRLNAIREKNNGESVGWEELLEVLNSENGWADYNIPGDRTTVYYGHTDPFVSSTALSTLIAEFYASARYNSGLSNFRELELDQVNNEEVQQGVRDIELLIRHYSSRTTEFKEYIAQGPDYLDFVALEENDLIYINQGKTQYQPPEKLVALYPKEGTFWHEHPFAIPNADWVTPEQEAAAKIFTEFIRSEPIQRMVMESGFRPVNPNVAIGYPIVPELGVDPQQPAAILDVPAPEVVAAVQASWQLVKKQADVLLVIDTSGSMEGSKIDQAKTAANIFLDNMPSQNRVGLVTFNSQPQVLSFTTNEMVYLDENSRAGAEPLVSFESGQNEIRKQIDTIVADGDTAMYDAIEKSIDLLQLSRGEEDNRIQAVVILSDGQDTASINNLQTVVSQIEASRENRNPVIVIPVAYGGDADINALNNIARSSATRVQSGDPENIQSLLELISSYF